MRYWLFFLGAICAVFTPLIQANACAQDQPRDGDWAALEEPFERGVDAYRRGAFEQAIEAWQGLSTGDLDDRTHAQLAYNLGNAYWRLDEPVQAMGWYTRAIRWNPRMGDAWTNLELVRQRLDLPPADRGDLRSTVERLMTMLRDPERRQLALLGIAAIALGLLFEILRGGRIGRWGLGLAVAVGLALLMPWLWVAATSQNDPVLVLRETSANLHSEPRMDRPVVAGLEGGAIVERVDALPGWVRVVAADGVRGWLPEDQVLSLPPR